MDDVGSGYATLDAVSLLQPDYVKMDRQWVDNCDSDANRQRYIDDLLERVSRFNGVVLAEGVQREEEWTYLRKAGVPLFQGYLFGRAAPVPAASGVRVR
ncbi:EAL domain-containing protein [Cohnella kolymensis]|uniref:EAL domain-containing protein n=1 Tax=Cohnella kolymensis TaxID=1590652 RepID=UPI00069797E7|nr:EAL domain-containing protein [Cohnella kolymensis]